jgi:multiple sugar transport system permease protein
MNNRRIAAKMGLYVVYAVVLVVFLFPLYWVLATSLKSIPELFHSPPVLWPKVPQGQNYNHVLVYTPVVTYLKNSAILVFFTAIGTLLVAIPAAFGFSRFRMRFSRQAMLGVLLCQMISPLVIVIPLYNYLNRVHLLNNYFAVILVYIAIQVPPTVWFLKGFLDTIPVSIEEAAWLDGCNRLQSLVRIVLPVSIPAIASATVLIVIESWSQFIVPFILLSSDRLYPVSVGLINLQSTSDLISTHYLAAASILAVLPVVVIFVVLQKFIVSALTAGSVKG